MQTRSRSSRLFTAKITRPLLTASRKINDARTQREARQVARAARIGLCTPGGNREMGLKAIAHLQVIASGLI